MAHSQGFKHVISLLYLNVRASIVSMLSLKGGGSGGQQRPRVSKTIISLLYLNFRVSIVSLLLLKGRGSEGQQPPGLPQNYIIPVFEFESLDS